jgi:cytoskeletal protein RodZ
MGEPNMTSCARYADVDIAERYVLGQMDESEQAAFEEHFFGCDPCLAEVQVLQQMQAALKAPAAVAAGAPGLGSLADTGASATMGSPSAASAAGRSQGYGAPGGTSTVTPFTRASSSAAASAAQASSSASASRMPAMKWLGLAIAASLLLGVMWWQRRATAPEPGTTMAQQNEPAQPGSSGQPGTGTGPGTGPSSTPQSPAPQPPAPLAPSPQQQVTPSQTPPSQTAPSQTPPSETTPSQTVPQRTTPESEPVQPARNLGVLALFVPPPYVPLQTRGAGDAQMQAFASAMARYNAKDYQAAAEQLKTLADAQPDAAYVQFFLGIALLMTDKPAEARQALDRAASSGTAPFNDEAHFYLAKGALRERDVERATRELQLAVQREAGPAGEAARLLRELKKSGR